MNITITNLFKRINAPLTNQRYSWGAICSDGTVVLRVWQDKKKRINNKSFMMITHHKPYKHRQGDLGYQERNRHVELIKKGAKCLMVMCLAKDVEAIPRTIKSFNKNDIFVGGKIIEEDGDVYIEIIDRITVKEIQNVLES